MPYEQSNYELRIRFESHFEYLYPAIIEGEGGQNLLTDSSKKTADRRGRGQKSLKFVDVLNGWSLCINFKFHGLQMRFNVHD